MYCAAELRRLTLAYVAFTGVSPSTLGGLVVNNKKWFKGLLSGRDVMASYAEIVSDFFNDCWPRDCPWPEGVPDRRSPQQRRRAAWRNYR